MKFISIHALREEGDDDPTMTAKLAVAFLSTPSARRATYSPDGRFGAGRNFYPRPPRGGRQDYCRSRPDYKKFLSTPSARRATLAESFACCSSRYFYPRPPRGGRLRLLPSLPELWLISIHALREEGDGFFDCAVHKTGISIHALREEGDYQGYLRRKTAMNFYPRPPRGGRPHRHCQHPRR